jgi:subtilisin family serine protease
LAPSGQRDLLVSRVEAPEASAKPLPMVQLPDSGPIAAVPGEIIVGREADAVLPVYAAGSVVQSLPLGRVYDLVRVPPGEEAAALAFFRGAPGVTSASLNSYLTPHAPPTNDPLLGYNWQYDADRAGVYQAWTDLDGALAASIGGITVAVVDSGVDPNHPDLSPNVLSGFLTTTVLDKNLAPSTTSFDQAADDHGTRVAGVIGAKKNNGLGGAGISPGAKILPLKDVEPSTGRITTLGLLNAVTIAAYYNQADSPFTWLKAVGNGNPISVCNISQGIPGSFGVQAAFQDAIDTAVAHGVTVVVSTGNEASEVTVPANSPSAIGVGVTMRYLGWELIAPYSNHGEAVFVTAPGNMIWSTAKGNAGDYSKAYKLFNGTSAAAPFTSSIAALIYAKYVGLQPRNRVLVARVKEKVRQSVDDLGPPGWDAHFGWGRVNAKKALQGTF